MYLITASLLNAWKYLMESEYSDVEDFMRVLRREPTEKTEAMAKGDAFEVWVKDNLPELQGASYQAALSVQHGDFLLYGRLDFVKAGIVYDTKFTSKYEVGKFYGNPQTSMYLELVPEAHKMVYIVSNSVTGDNIWREEYRRDEVPPITDMVRQFHDWLLMNDLASLYHEKWQSRW